MNSEKKKKNGVWIGIAIFIGILIFGAMLPDVPTDPESSLTENNKSKEDKANEKILVNTNSISKSLAETINTKLKEVGFSTLQSAEVIQNESEEIPMIILVKSSDLIIDVEIKESKITKIFVSSNGGNVELANELILYNFEENLTKKISTEELTSYKQSQKDAAYIEIKNYVRSLVSLTKFTRSNPNSVGGVTVYMNVKNNSSKTIKYVHASFFAKNAVGDQVYCTIRGSGIRKVTMTGPIEPGAIQEGKASEYWYNSTVKSYGFNYFEIEYMDGTNIVFTTEMLNALVSNYNGN